MGMKNKSFRSGSKRLADNARELEFHIETEAQENIARGMRRDEAYRAARRKLGNTTRIREDVYRMAPWAPLEAIFQDLQYALRYMRKNPAFTLTAIFTLALGIGANTAMFTIIRAVLLKPLQFAAPEQLVGIGKHEFHSGKEVEVLAPTQLEDLRRNSRSFVSIAAHLKVAENMTLSDLSAPLALKGARVSANLLGTLGIKPLLGRDFLPEEDASSAPRVMIISSDLWKRRYHADPQIVGRQTILNAQPYTIVGVLPQGFQSPFPGVDVWVTRPTEWSLLPPRFWGITPLSGIARLKPGVTLKQARAEMNVLDLQYKRAHPDLTSEQQHSILRLTNLQNQVVSGVRLTLWVLLGAVSFVLLIACANVAGLLLARSASRSREFALRSAVGASGWRLIRQLLVESVVLALAGGASGIVFAFWLLQGASHITALTMPGVGPIQPDLTILLSTLVLSIATGVAFGLLPALQASRQDLIQSLRLGASQGIRASYVLKRWGASGRGFLVIGQVALSIALLVGAVLLMKSFLNLQYIDPGFSARNVLTAKITLPNAAYDSDEKRNRFYRELLSHVRGKPGITSAAVTMSIPTIVGWIGTNVLVDGQPVVDGKDQPTARMQSVTPDYFAILGIPLRRGRFFTEQDASSPLQAGVIINESFARRFWPNYPLGPDPIGKHIREGIDHTGQLPILGIVGDPRELDLTAEPDPEFFVPTVVHSPQIAYLIVRTIGKPANFANAIHAAVHETDSNQAVSDVKPMADILDAGLGQRRLTMRLVAVFAGAAALLSLIGIYGLIAYSVVERRQEMGIRRALGAQQSSILLSVIGHALTLALFGIAIGFGVALLLSRVLSHLLFQVTATDPLSFALCAATFLVAAAFASLLPAWRAASSDPMTALRV
jgi:putative ABC transport system permease protein